MTNTYEMAAEADADRARQKTLHRIEIMPIHRTEKGQHYRVTYAGRVLLEDRRNPVFDACRALLARGLTGTLEVWRPDKTSAEMQLDIERGARFAVHETEMQSLRLARWESRPDSILYRGREPLAAKRPSSVG